MTDSTILGIQTVLHPVSDLKAATALYSALLGQAPQAEFGDTTSASTSPASRSGWCRGAGRRA